ncbi:MAG: YggS family pyridoxal phosphate-dependent enzyme [Novipirellula sp. JB048]
MNEAQRQTRLSDNWQAVVQEVQAATAAAKRPLDSVKIIGVTKYVDAETALALVNAGCQALGESRPQELWKKAEAVGVAEPVEWHLVGQLQRNKLRRTIRYRPQIHSVNSQRLLAAIVEEARAQSQSLEVLLQVNISGEANKTGMMPEALQPILETHLDSQNDELVKVAGLMAMAGWGTDSEEARRQFAATRELRDEMQRRTGVALPELSMGMSGDFDVAIEEGATMVRIGSRLFAGMLEP